jgi:predicted RNA-binding protein with PUA-like domain
MLVDVKVLCKTEPLTLAELRAHRSLADLRVLQKGNRLSITPVSAAHWRALGKLLHPARVAR